MKQKNILITLMCDGHCAGVTCKSLSRTLTKTQTTLLAGCGSCGSLILITCLSSSIGSMIPEICKLIFWPSSANKPWEFSVLFNSSCFLKAFTHSSICFLLISVAISSFGFEVLSSFLEGLGTGCLLTRIHITRHFWYPLSFFKHFLWLD